MMNAETLFWITSALVSLEFAGQEEMTSTYRRWLSDAIWQVRHAIDSLEDV